MTSCRKIVKGIAVWALVVSSIFPACPAAGDVTASQGTRADGVKVKWNAVTPTSGAAVDEIDIWRDGEWMATLPVSATSWKDTSLTAGGKANAHEYQVSRWIELRNGMCTGPILGSATGWLPPQIRFKANGGAGTMPVQSLVGERGHLAANAFYRNGYAFVGWSDESGEDNWVCYRDSEEIKTDIDMKLYAVWTLAVTANGYSWMYVDDFEDGSIRLTGVSPVPSGNLTFPSAVLGQPVRGIGWGPCRIGSGVGFDFSRCTGFVLPTSLQFLDSGDFLNSSWWKNQADPVLTCGDWAVGLKRGASTVTIPVGVKKIAVNFAVNAEAASSVTCIVIPDGVKTLCPQAFYGLPNLGEVHVPASVKRVGDYTFDDEAPGPFYFHGEKPTTVYDCAGYVVDDDDPWGESCVFGWRENEDRVIYFKRGAEGWEDGGEWCGLVTYAWDPPPTCASGVSASDGTYSDKIRVTWNKAVGATGYQIYRCIGWMPTGAAGLVATVTGADVTSWEDLGVPEFGADHRYSYFVVAGMDNADGYNFGQLSGGDSGWRTARKMTVKFKGNGGTVSPSTREYAEDGTYGAFPSVFREGYDFAGWYTSSTGGKRILATSAVDSTVGKLYARWIEPGASLSCAISASVGGAYEGSLVSEYDEDWGELYDFGCIYYKVRLLKGHEYVICLESDAKKVRLNVDTDWDDESAPWASFDYAETPGCQSAILYADSWDANDPDSGDYYICVSGEIGDGFRLQIHEGLFAVRMDEAGGSACETVCPLVGDALLIHLSTPTRFGHQFKGWKLEDCTLVDENTRMPPRDVLLTAKWKTIDQPYFETTNVKVSESSAYAEIKVLRNGTRGALNVDFETYAGSSGDSSQAQPRQEYEETSGTLVWADGDGSERVIRVRLIPDLIDRWEVAKKFYVRMTPRECDVVGAPVCTVKIKESAAKRSGEIVVLDQPLTVAESDWLEIEIARVNGSDGRVKAFAKTQDGTAVAPNDYYRIASTPLVWEDGDSESKILRLYTKANDSFVDKTMNVKIFVAAEEGFDLPSVPQTKAYITIVGEHAHESVPVTKATFTVQGPGLFTAVPTVANGSGRIKWRMDAEPYAKVESGTTLNRIVPAGNHMFVVKLTEQEANASLRFIPQNQGLDYRFLPMADTSRIQVAADGTLRDSKGRELLAVRDVELTQGVSSSFGYYEISEGPVELVGGSLPKGLSIWDPATAPGPDILTLAAGIMGTPAEAEDCTALLRVTSGKNKKRIIQINFKVEPLGSAAGQYYGVLYGENEYGEEGVQYRQLGWLKVSVAESGAVTAKAKIDGRNYKFASDFGLSLSEGDGIQWAEADLSHWQEIGGLSCATRLALRLPRSLPENGTSGRTCGTAELAVDYPETYCICSEDDDGCYTELKERRYNCQLYRIRSEESAREAVRSFAGYYTVALVPETWIAWYDSPNCGNGYLTLTVNEDATVAYAGMLADGSSVSGTSVAQVFGEFVQEICATDEKEAVMRVPVSFTYGEDWSRSYFGGVLEFRFPTGSRRLCGPAVAAAEDVPLDWNCDTGWPRAVRLMPVGGYYNTLYNLQTYYFGCDFALRATGADSTAFRMNINQFAELPGGIKSSTFVRETGVVSGKFYDQNGTKVKFNAINLLQKADADRIGDDVFATGFCCPNASSSGTELFEINLK